MPYPRLDTTRCLALGAPLLVFARNVQQLCSRQDSGHYVPPGVGMSRLGLVGHLQNLTAQVTGRACVCRGAKLLVEGQGEQLPSSHPLDGHSEQTGWHFAAGDFAARHGSPMALGQYCPCL